MPIMKSNNIVMLGEKRNLINDNVYFITGLAYAGKSTLVKNLALKHGGIALEENYHDAKLSGLDANRTIFSAG